MTSLRQSARRRLTRVCQSAKLLALVAQCGSAGAMKCDRFCPLCYANVRGRSNYRGHRHYLSPRKKPLEYWDMYVKRISAAAGGSRGAAMEDDAAFMKKYPATWEYMTQQAHEDGKPRVLAKMTVACTDGRWSVCFVDNDNKRLMFLSGLTMAGLLDSLEKKLATDTAEWRPAKAWGKKS